MKSKTGPATSWHFAPPGPRGHRVIGNLKAYEEDRLGFLMQSARQYGPVVRYSDEVYILNAPSLVEETLRRTNQEFAQDHDTQGQRIDTVKGSPLLERWMSQRRAAGKGMSPRVVSAHADRLFALTESHISSWQTGKPVQVFDEMKGLTSKVVADFCCGPDGTDLPKYSSGVLDGLGDLLGSPFHFPSWVPLNRNRRPRRAIADLEAELNRIADQRLRVQHRDQFDLLSALIDGEEALPPREACNILVTILLAAHGVPAAAMAWLWLLLYEHPLEERRLHAEIDAAVGRSRTIGAGDLVRMPFTTAVVKETLRLYPPTWLLARQVVEPYELGGYRLIPGQYVIMSPYVLQRDPTHFDRPDDFVPARWLDEVWVRQLPKYAYCPFSAGPRGCLGMPLAMVELPLLTATIARRFRFVPTRDGSVGPDSRLILIPREFEALVETRGLAADYDSSGGESRADVSVV